MHDQVRGAVVDEATAHILFGEKWAQLSDELLFTVVFKNHILVLFDDGEALVENLRTVLLAHKRFELGELTRRNVDHFFLAHVAGHVGVLAFVIDC